MAQELHCMPDTFFTAGQGILVLDAQHVVVTRLPQSAHEGLPVQGVVAEPDGPEGPRSSRTSSSGAVSSTPVPPDHGVV